MVGVLVADDGKHPTDNDVADFGIQPLISLDLLPRDGQCFHKFFIRYLGKINKLLVEPISV